MKSAAMNSDPSRSKHFLLDLEQRHNDVLDQLDDLNRRLESALADARKQFQPASATFPPAATPN
jgi:hypothetical protein